MDRELTPKQERFCQLYTTYWEAARAAREAGYSEKTCGQIGYQLLQLDSIKARIKELTDHALKEIGVSKERILQELARVAFVNMKDLASWNESGMQFKPSDQIEHEHAAAIAEVSEVVTEYGGTLKLRQHDKLKALELLGKYQKLFADRIEHSGPDGKPIETKNSGGLTDEQLDAKIQRLMGAVPKSEPNASG